MNDNEDFDLDLGYDISSIKKSSNTHPDGEFEFEIQRMKFSLNKAEDIKTLEITLVNVETQRRAFIRHPFSSTRETMKGMVEKGNDRIRELGDATGIAGSNLAPMIGKRVRAVITTKAGSGGYEDSNEVRRYKSVDGQQALPAAPTSNAPGFMRKG